MHLVHVCLFEAHFCICCDVCQECTCGEFACVMSGCSVNVHEVVSLMFLKPSWPRLGYKFIIVSIHLCKNKNEKIL